METESTFRITSLQFRLRIFRSLTLFYGLICVVWHNLGQLETLATQAKQQKQLEQLEQLQQQLQQQQESMDRGLIATTTLSTKEFPKPPFRLEDHAAFIPSVPF
jgi:hypothetical protein